MSSLGPKNGLDNWMGEYLEYMHGDRDRNPTRSELGLSTGHPLFGDLAFHANALLRAKILERTGQTELRQENTASPMFSEREMSDIVMELNGDPTLLRILSAVREAVKDRAAETPLAFRVLNRDPCDQGQERISSRNRTPST